MKQSKLFLILLICVGLMVGGTSLGISAEKYPTRSILWVCPWSSDNESAAMAQILADMWGKKLGERITVTCITGGGGAKAANYVKNRKADGYTIFDAWVAPLVVGPLYRPDIGYTYEDFTYLGGLTLMPFTLAVRKDSPWKNLHEFVEYARKHPGMRYNATSAISVPHMVMMRFLEIAGIEAIGIPYPGLMAGIPDFLGGALDFTVGNMALIARYGEEIRTLCIFADERHPWYPDIPTAKELGYDLGFGKAGYGWDAPAVKKGTPDYIVEKLRETYKEVVTSEEFQKRCKDIGMWIVYATPEEIYERCEKTTRLLKPYVDKLLKEQKQ